MILMSALIQTAAKHLTLLLLIGLAWGQDNLEKESDFDKLVSKGDTIFLGEY